MFTKAAFLNIPAFISILIISCSGGNMPEEKVTFPSIKDVPVEKWEKLSQKKIFFGHQSVGNNIINGIRDLMKEHPEIKVNIVETADESDFKDGIFAHSAIGKNEDPLSKINAFAAFMEKGIGGNADIASFKFCFVDIDSSTDTKALFAAYENKMAFLKLKYPQTILMHFTAPLLRKTNSSFKGWIKKMLGKQDGFFANSHNIARNEFNELLRREYDGKEPLFDLAKVESTHPDGTRETFKEDGKTYFSLVPEYTDDGGHLNEAGRKKVAEQLLIYLANLS
jgi:hypothetical protein